MRWDAITSHAAFPQATPRPPAGCAHGCVPSLRPIQARPNAPGVNFKLVNQREQMWSARINDQYRALGIRDGSDITWFWIGEHDEYERIIRKGP
jgi:hypothetical protein